MIRVLLADDQALVRGGFRSILDGQDDIDVVAEAADGAEAVEQAPQIGPLIAHGRSNAEIGATLFLSEPTIKTHVTRILAKLHLRDRVQACSPRGGPSWAARGPITWKERSGNRRPGCVMHVWFGAFGVTPFPGLARRRRCEKS
jgi:Bacterial regulatory proteins, luxR family